MDYQVETNIYQTDAIADGIRTGIQTYDDELDQQKVYDRLTNYSADQGVFLEDGKLYINASMIHAGYLSADHIRGGTLTLGGSGNESGAISVYDDSENLIGKWDKDGLVARDGNEYLAIRQSVLYGGLAPSIDGTLDLSAQQYSQQDVVLDALTYDLWLRSRNGVVNVSSLGDTKINCANLEIAVTSTNTLGYPVLTFNDAQSHNIRYAYISTSGSSRYLYVMDGTGNTYRTSALTAV